MFDSPASPATTADAVEEPVPPPPPAAPSVEQSSTEVLITEQEVVFSTAAAVGVRRENIGRRLVAFARRLFATSTDASRPRPRHHPKRYEFLVHALMAREMDRL